jgi:RNA polymerase sigma-70 factor (ECF subfamily)
MQTNPPNDHALVQQYLHGNEQALAVLLNRHKQKVYTSIYLFVRDRYIAEDLFQDTFMKVVDKLREGRYHEEGKFLPWVMRIAQNLCVDYYRKTKRTPKVTTQDGFDIFKVLNFAGDNAEQTMIANQTQQRVKFLIDQLPEEQKEVVILRHYSNLSFKEISDLTNVSINTALGRMRYALINIRRMMTEKQIAL